MNIIYCSLFSVYGLGTYAYGSQNIPNVLSCITINIRNPNCLYASCEFKTHFNCHLV